MLLKDSKYNDYMEAWMSKSSGDIMVVSGYNSGQELRKYIRAQKHFTLDIVTDILHQVIDSTQYYHSKGQTLGYINPQNVLKRYDNTVYLKGPNQTIAASKDGTTNFVVPLLWEK